MISLAQDMFSTKFASEYFLRKYGLKIAVQEPNLQEDPFFMGYNVLCKDKKENIMSVKIERPSEEHRKNIVEYFISNIEKELLNKYPEILL